MLMSIGTPSFGHSTILGMATTTLGRRVAQVREALGMNQAEFARKIGISPPSLSQLESGESGEPKGSTLLGMILAGANPQFVMKGSGPVLIPEHERKLDAQTLLSTFEEMTPENKRALLDIAKTLRRAQPGAGPNDPFKIDPPSKPPGTQ